MATVRIRVHDEAVRRKLSALGNPAAVVVPMARVLVDEARRIINISKPLVPFDTGRLRGTGRIMPPEYRPTAVRVAMEYGGDMAPYAVIQHERLDFHHPTPGTQAKYLEEPMLRERDQTIAAIRDGVREAIERVVR